MFVTMAFCLQEVSSGGGGGGGELAYVYSQPKHSVFFLLGVVG